MHVHDLIPFQGVNFDLSHRIDKLSFGHEYPGMANPLDRVQVAKHNTRNPQGLSGAYQYFLKVLPSCCTLALTACLEPSTPDLESVPIHPQCLIAAPVCLIWDMQKQCMAQQVPGSLRAGKYSIPSASICQAMQEHNILHEGILLHFEHPDLS